MKTTTVIAFNNMKYYKSKNILTGIAIVLTTSLLFVIPAAGNGILEAQFVTINKIYPTWHALFRNVDKATATEMAAHHDIAEYGLRSDAGIMGLEDASVSMISLDEKGAELYRMELLEGNLPRQENEIVVSKGILMALGQQGTIGDTIKVPYQIFRDGQLDYTQEREFRISGFLEDSKASLAQQTFVAVVSESFIESEMPKGRITYRFLFQVKDEGSSTTDDIEYAIHEIARQFGISENEININQDYLYANYVDPAYVPAIAGVMLVTVMAGILTIYSIYYMSMNQRIQEFGRLKAIGATKRQMRQIVLREGFCVAVAAIPAGLLLGTLTSKIVLMKFVDLAAVEDGYSDILREVIRTGEVPLYHWWTYLLAIAVTLGTVYLSLIKLMNMAAGVSEVEAMRFHDAGIKRSQCKGYESLTIGRLAGRNLTGNKKKSAITIISMALTGVLLMVVATVISCANPKDSADNSIVGQYEISPVIENNNREHPERKWTNIQQDNPMNEGLKEQVEELAGVIRVDSFTTVYVTGEPFEEGVHNAINGIPEEYAKEIEDGIVEGKITYEELKAGDKIIVDQTLLHWYPDLEIGQRLNLTVYDGTRTYEKEFVIAAIGDYRHGLINYHYLITAKEAADKLCENNSTEYFHVIADKDYDPELDGAIRELVEGSGRLELNSWKAEYDKWKTSLAVLGGASYAFLGILGAISVMNLVNTMINSVHLRKKELGMMQAIGMSDRQLMKMLQIEGLFYTLGTLAATIGLGSLAGYPLFLYAKKAGMFEISNYHYPWAAAVTVSVVLLLIQAGLTLGIAKSVKKDPLIERIRFNE